MSNTKVIAHRGASNKAPENTIPAFQTAIRQGADGIELDVQMSKDGELVVIHDEQIDRTSNSAGRVCDFNLVELKSMDFGSWFSKEYESISLPTLREVMDIIKDTKLNLNIEIKNGIINYQKIEEKIIDLVSKYNLDDRVIYSSFNHYSLMKIKKINSDAKIGLLYVAGLYEPWQYAQRLGADALHPLYLSLNDEIVSKCTERDIIVNTYTVDDEVSMVKLFNLGIDGIITNKPDIAINIKQNGGYEWS